MKRRAIVLCAIWASILTLGALSLPALASGESDRQSSPTDSPSQNGIEVYGTSDKGGAPTVYPVSGKIEKLDASDVYGQTVKEVLELTQVEILRRSDVDADGKPITYDEINRYTTETGFQASIFHQLPSGFAVDHDEGGFPKFDTKVGPAWISVTGGDTISVALIDSAANRAIRVVYHSDDKQLPEVIEVVKRAVQLAENSTIDSYLSNGG